MQNVRETRQRLCSFTTCPELIAVQPYVMVNFVSLTSDRSGSLCLGINPGVSIDARQRGTVNSLRGTDFNADRSSGNKTDQASPWIRCNNDLLAITQRTRLANEHRIASLAPLYDNCTIFLPRWKYWFRVATEYGPLRKNPIRLVKPLERSKSGRLGNFDDENAPRRLYGTLNFIVFVNPF